jgi:hypothetical protein
VNGAEMMLAGMNHHEQSPEFTRYLCNPFKQKFKRTTGQKLKQQQYINKEDRCAYNKTKDKTKYNNDLDHKGPDNKLPDKQLSYSLIATAVTSN